MNHQIEAANIHKNAGIVFSDMFIKRTQGRLRAVRPYAHEFSMLPNYNDIKFKTPTHVIVDDFSAKEVWVITRGTQEYFIFKPKPLTATK